VIKRRGCGVNTLDKVLKVAKLDTSFGGTKKFTGRRNGLLNQTGGQKNEARDWIWEKNASWGMKKNGTGLKPLDGKGEEERTESGHEVQSNGGNFATS